MITAAQYDKEMQIARTVQQGLLSIEDPEIPGVRVVKSCIPASSIGGDFYAFVNKSERGLSARPKQTGVIEYIDKRNHYLGIAIGDVAGHGIGSALVMALASGIVREAGLQHRSAGDTLTASNLALFKFLENAHISHVTLLYAVLNTETKILSYAKGGHLPAILIKADGELSLLDGDGVFLGMYPDEVYSERSVQLSPGDRVFFYTDGIVEAQDGSGELFDYDRLYALLLEHREDSIEVLLQKVFRAVSEFTGDAPVQDDQTMVILEIT